MIAKIEIVEKEEFPLIRFSLDQKEFERKEIVENKEIIYLKYKEGKEIFLGSKAYEAFKKYKAKCIDLKNIKDQKSFVEGFLLSSYVFTKYKEKREEIIKILNAKREEIIKAKIICNAVNFARDISNEPSNKINPETFVKEVEKFFEEEPTVLIEILNENDLEREKLEGILTIGNSSKNKPRVLILKYLPTDKKPIVLIGKGVTFDAGGLNIKPAEAMYEMNKDKSGAAVVASTIYAISKLKLPINVIGVIPLVENVISENSCKPGDIIRIGNKTVEIVHTDAEGRIILADAVEFSKRFNPEIIITIATLTGAQIVALGYLIAAFYSNDKELTRKVLEASKKTKEFVWKMPLPKFYEKLLIKGEISDIKNVPSVTSREAGSIVGALFIKQFIDRKWIHLDIAGPAIINKDWYFLKKGGTGFGTRLLIQLLESLA
jgi:leucyl aminopeptidase